MTEARVTRRIGLVIPSSSSTQEPEFARALPEGFTVHAARTPLTRIQSDQTARLVENIETECAKLGDAQVDVIALPATAPSSQKGAGGEKELIARMTKASGRPATVAAAAMLDALRELGVKRVVVGAPWSQTVNESVVAFLRQNGIEVLDHQALGHVDNLEVGRLDESTAYEMGRRVDRPDAEAVILACGNWRTMGVIEQLEGELKKPVVSTNLVTLWSALRLVGGLDRIDGYGSLLRDHLKAAARAAE